MYLNCEFTNISLLLESNNKRSVRSKDNCARVCYICTKMFAYCRFLEYMPSFQGNNGFSQGTSRDWADERQHKFWIIRDMMIINAIKIRDSKNNRFWSWWGIFFNKPLPYSVLKQVFCMIQIQNIQIKVYSHILIGAVENTYLIFCHYLPVSLFYWNKLSFAISIIHLIELLLHHQYFSTINI